MKIAFAIEHFNPLHGGAEGYAWRLARWLTDRGHTLEIFTRINAAPPCDGIHIHLVPVRNFPRATRPLRFGPALASEFASGNFDVIHGFNHVWPCDILRLGGGVHLAFEKFNRLSIPCPVHRMMKGWFDNISPQNIARRINEFHQFDSPTRLFMAVSQKVADDMRAYYPAAAERIHLVRNGIDLAVFNPETARAARPAARRRLNLDDHTLTFLFISNNFALKGLTLLIEALSVARQRLPAYFKVLIVGRGDRRRYMAQARAAGLGENIQFESPTPTPIDLYAAADILLHPTYYDACANVCLEAMACGLPVLTSHGNGAAEMMEHGRGAIIIDMPCPVTSLAEAVVNIADPAFLSRAGDCQWERTRELTIENNFHRVYELYEMIAAQKKRMK